MLLGDASQGEAEARLGAEGAASRSWCEMMVDADVAGLQDQMSGKVTRYSHEGV